MEKEIRKVLEKLIKETPNDTELGKKIRRLYVPLCTKRKC